MWEEILMSGALQGTGTGLAWVITCCLLAAGLVGCVLPILPGHLILLIAVFAYRMMLVSESGLHWWSFVILIALMAISQTFEMLSGAAGSKWFGGTRWGAVGALIGSIAGMFFLPLGLLIGPLLGAFVAEIAFAKKDTKPAAISGVGSVVGTLAGMAFKIVIGLAMVAWFVIDVFLIGK